MMKATQEPGHADSRSRRSIRHAILLLVLALAMVVQACSQGDTSPDTTGTDSSAPGSDTTTVDTGSGGTTPADGPEPLESVVLSGPIPVLTLDSTQAGDPASLLVHYLSQGQLFRFDENFVPTPDLAETVEFSDDGLTLTITLREGALYSDGTSVTADDVVVAFDRAKAGIANSYVSSIDSAEAIDERTTVFHLAYTDPDVLIGITGRVLPINPADQVLGNPDYFDAPVSAGPYVVDDWAPGDDEIRLVENPNYWAGPMMAQEIRIVSIPDESSRVIQLMSGEVDFAWDVPLAAASSFPDSVSTQSVLIGGYTYLVADESGDTFSDPVVRKAMSLALDRGEISDRAFFGQAPPATSFMYDCGSLCEPGLLPNGGVQDLDTARSLLAESGWTQPSDALELLVVSRPGMVDGAVVIAEQLAEVGIDVEVTPVDQATWVDAFVNHNYDLIYGAGSAPPQAALQQVFHRDGWWAQGVAVASDDTTALVEQAAAETNPDVRRGLYSEIQTLAQDTMPVITITNRVELVAWSSPDGLLARPMNSQLINVQTLSQAEGGLSAGQYP